MKIKVTKTGPRHGSVAWVRRQEEIPGCLGPCVEDPKQNWLQRLYWRIRLWLHPVRFKRIKTARISRTCYPPDGCPGCLRDVISSNPMKDLEDREIDSRFIFTHKDDQ